MVRAWYIDSSDVDHRLEHHLNPPKFLTLEELFTKTCVEHFKIDVSNYKEDHLLSKLRSERNYSYEDEVTISRDRLPDYDNKLILFFEEHLHTDDEIRLVLEGSGYFDVRDDDDNWIRIEIVAGDLIIIPAGIYHRFSLDTKNYVKAKRYFVGEPFWQPYNRPSEEMDCRKEFLKRQASGIPIAQKSG